MSIRRRSRTEVADEIERFLNGTCGPWDWDEFTSFPIEDPELDAIRKQLAHLPVDYPPSEPGHYASDEGKQVALEIVERLRSK